MQINEMPMVRVFFEKTGRAKYTSHLDSMRMLTRALRRSGLPLWYTMGFNPHLYLTFALPIALGYESVCESMDLRLTKEFFDDDVVKALNAVLPPGFRALRAAVPVLDPGRIAWADYGITLLYADADIPALLRKWDVFMAQPVIEVTKKTKKGEKLMDLRPHVEVLEQEAVTGGLQLRLRLAAGNTLNVAPTLLLKSYYKWANLEPDGVKVIRRAILTDELQNFA